MQPPQGNWGPPQQPQWGNAPQQPQWGSAPQPGWMNADAGFALQVKRLDDELQTWLIVAGCAWLFGLWIIVGPAAWWKSGDLKLKYESLRAPVPSNVGVLKLIGVVTCVLMVLATLFVLAVFAFGLAFASRMHQT